MEKKKNLVTTFDEVKQLINSRQPVTVRHGERFDDDDIVWDNWIENVVLCEDNDWVKNYGGPFGVSYEEFGGIPYHHVNKNGLWARCEGHEHVLQIKK